MPKEEKKKKANKKYYQKHKKELKEKARKRHINTYKRGETPIKIIKYRKRNGKLSDIRIFKDWNGKNSPSWKGDKAGYDAIHKGIRKNKPKPKFCEYLDCKQKPMNVANISGKYRRDIKDYKWVCVRHHRILDGVGWSNKDLTFLKKNYKVMKDNQLAERINKSRNAIVKMRIKIGLKKY